MTQPPDDSEPIVAVATPELVPALAPLPDEAAHAGVALRSVVGFKLAMAMFLHHFTLGAWIVTLGSYVEANSGSAGSGIFSAGFVGIAYGAGPLGGMVSPFITGLLADHFFATERILAVMHIAGAMALAGAVAADSQAAFYLAMIGYFVFFIPSFALVSSMTLHHLAQPARDFPLVRAVSTVGWIAAGVFVGGLWPLFTGDVIEATAVPMKIGVVGELVTAAYCLMLPHTPPANKVARTPAGISGSQTLDLIRQPSFLALLALAMLAHIPSQFYYAYCNAFLNSWVKMDAAAAKMALGQVVEVACMLALPAVLLRISIKTSIIIGMAIWMLRFWMLSAAASPTLPGRDGVIYAAILLHGIAFTLVTISLQLDVDRCAGRKRRATAQGLLAVAMSGFGCFAGAQLSGIAGAQWLPADLDAATVQGWQAFWSLPAWIAAGVMVAAALALPKRP